MTDISQENDIAHALFELEEAIRRFETKMQTSTSFREQAQMANTVARLSEARARIGNLLYFAEHAE